MRKSIFDIVKDNTNLANDVLRLDSMFLKEEFSELIVAYHIR